jgi:alpha-1,3-glucosyltransferase
MDKTSHPQEGVGFGLLLRLYCVTALLKALLVRAPYSTDLLVHLHWKSLTRRFPVSAWYTPATGPPYLDYPTCFAYLEWFLGALAQLLRIPLEHENGSMRLSTLIFMRITVIALDVFLFLGMRPWCAGPETAAAASFPSVVLDRLLWVVTHPALWLVDNIHFQYNGLVIGVILYSLGVLFRESVYAEMEKRRSQRGMWRASAAFLVALGLKHTTALSIAPVVGLVLWKQRAWKNIYVVVSGFVWLLLMLGLPFGCVGWRALWERLFPLDERGLFHAYWAPNAYALLAAADKVVARFCALVFSRLVERGLAKSPHGSDLLPMLHRSGRVSNSAGLVQTAGGGFYLLPEWTPMLAMLCCVVAMTPSLLALHWAFQESARHGETQPASSDATAVDRLDQRRCMEFLAKICAQVSLSLFLFGWHVHEKALILPVFLAGLGLGPRHPVAAALSTACSLAMFPLVSSPGVRLVRLALLFWHWLYFAPLQPWPPTRAWLLVYSYGGIGLMIGELLASWHGWQRLGLPFLPLMLQSVYSALAVVFAWGYLSWQVWRSTRADYMGCSPNAEAKHLLIAPSVQAGARPLLVRSSSKH